jgi:hemerythrin-like domain-containing protein
MNNSLKMLFDEHDIITGAIEIAKNAKSLIGKNNTDYEFTISELIRFFRVYADQYHHHKEEVILFPEMEKKNDLLADGVIKEMLDNHAYFRELILAIEYELEKQDYPEAAVKIDEYTEALLDHIAVENDELFQTAYSLFTEEELENIYYRFIDLDRDLGETKKKDFADLLKLLNKPLQII